jgi:hypothetical protein
VFYGALPLRYRGFYTGNLVSIGYLKEDFPALFRYAIPVAMKNLYTPTIFDFVFFGLTEGENSQRLSHDSNIGL